MVYLYTSKFLNECCGRVVEKSYAKGEYKAFEEKSKNYTR
jgi:hypothetical protein